MAFIQNIDQFREHFGLNASSDGDTYMMLLPDMLLQEDEHIRPVLGDVFYQEFHDLAQVPSLLDEKQYKLLTLLRSSLANLTILSYLDLGQLQISGAGVQIISSDNQKTAFQWQIEALKANVSRKGFNGLEKVLAFLDTNTSSFPMWASSAAARRHRELFINSAQQFTEHYNINNARLTFLSLVSLVRKTEDFALQPVLGTEYFEELKEQLVDDELTDENRSLVEKYLQPALAHMTIARAIGELGFGLNGNALELNIYRPDNSNSKESDPGLEGLLNQKTEQALEDGAKYLRRMRKHLNKTASATRYATYFNSPAYQAPTASGPLLNNSSDPIYGAF